MIEGAVLDSAVLAWSARRHAGVSALRALIPILALLASLGLSPARAAGETARQTLTEAAFFTSDKAAALAGVNAAEAQSLTLLRRNPGDAEAKITRALAASYRAKLINSRGEALAARALFEKLVADDAGNAEAQAALGGWHIEALATLGSMVGRMALGARRNVGLAALDRAVALGGNRAMFAGLAALLRAELDPADPHAKSLAEAAVKAPTPTALDRIMQKSAGELLTVMRAGSAAAIKAKSHALLPFGRIGG